MHTTRETGPSVVVKLPPAIQSQNEAKGEKTSRVASLPSSADAPVTTVPPMQGNSLRIVFEGKSSKLPRDARAALKTVSTRMNQQKNLRLQLVAYAGSSSTSASAARRLSLSRALAVRSFLIENGVRSTRIDVRALGNKSSQGVTERVDITIVKR